MTTTGLSVSKHLIEVMIVNLPNFLGLLITIYLLWRILERYLPDDDE